MLRLVAVLVAVLLTAQAQIPRATQPLSKGEQTNAQAKPADKEAVQDRRGTEAAPLVVKVLAPPGSEGKAARETEDRKKQATTETDLADYTWYLVLATIGLAIVALGQAGLFVWQLVDLGKATKAATQQARVAQETFEKLERPYLYVTDVTGFGFAPGTDWADTPFVPFKVVNHGKTPAQLDEMLIVNESTPNARPDLGIGDVNATIRRNSVFGPGEETADRVFYPDQGELPHNRRVKWRFPNENEDDTAPWGVLPEGETYFFRVILRYRGPFTRGHETSACWRLEGGSTFEPFGGDEFNYVR